MPVTLADIARELSVSKMTVSRAINNHPLINAELRVPLTTVSWSRSEMGQQAARLLLQLVEGEVPDRKQVVLPTELVVRRSSGVAA